MGWHISREDKIGIARMSAVSVRRHCDHARIDKPTSKAALTDSSQRSNINSSSAIDSLLTLIIRWHNCGRKNSISS